MNEGISIDIKPEAGVTIPPPELPVDQEQGSAATALLSGSSLPTLEELGIDSPDVIKKLEACEVQWKSSERKDAEVVFTRGEVVAKARDLCGSQDMLDKWCKIRLQVTRRGAENYERVHRTLGSQSRRFIKAGVSPTVMYKLLAATPEKIEAVLDHYEAGHSMTAAKAAAFVQQDDAKVTPSDEVSELGGADGIRQLVREKMKATLPDISSGLQAIMAACLAGLDDHHRGVRVKKGELADLIEDRARIVRARLENIAFDLEPGLASDPWRLYIKMPPNETGRGNLARILLTLGGRGDWGTPLGPWLIDEVIPALEWGLGSKLAEAVHAEDARRLEAIAADKATQKVRRRVGHSRPHTLPLPNGEAPGMIASLAM